MNQVLAIARKELRGYFGSAVALIFLATFLSVTVFTFFWVEKFFSRNIADVRPMFDWLPLLLIFLVAALSMRLWSEEQKVGTIEVLLTLPVPRHRLVLGKFLAGMALIALALVLTLGLPITVSMMGDLDWGPVIGGYLAALLLAGAYLSVGLCVSAATDNQIVSLIVTVLVCAALYLPGVQAVTGMVSTHAGEILRDLGTGSRFESIARGVIDLRDLAYYGSLIAVFLTLNTVLLAAKGWSRGPRTRSQRNALLLTAALVAGNAVALDLWMAPVARARVDLTENKEYSLSPTTEHLLASLDQPLLIRAYFSEKTHPLLAPLVPQIKDMLEEYRVAGGGRIRVEVVDPSSDPAVEKEAREQYDIKSVPFRFADRHETSVVNSYFHILVAYGDQYQVLSFNDLIEVKAVDIGQIEVRLRNLEYDLTRSIKKVVYGFQSLDAVFAALPGKVTLTAYITPDTLPANWKELPDKLRAVVAKLGEDAGGKLSFEQVAPTDDGQRRELYKKYGFQPFATSLTSRDVFYAHLVLSVAGKEVPFLPPEELTEAALESSITDVLRRAAPGFVKRVGLWAPPATPAMPSMPGAPPQRGRPPQSFELLRQTLGENYQVDPVDLSSGRVDDGIEVLVLAGPANLGDAEQRAVDQFVMRGGALIVLDGRFRLDLGGDSLKVSQVTSGLEAMLADWGVTVAPKLVLDEHNDSFPVPVARDLGGMVVREMKLLPYPFFVRADHDGLADDSPVTARLNTVIMHWASPVVVKPPAAPAATAKSDHEAATPPTVTTLVRSSDDAWLQATTDVQPDLRRHPGTGFARPSKLADGDSGTQPLAVTMVGSFTSHLAGKAAADGDKGASKDEHLIERSPPDTRIAVIGSSSFASDEVIELSRSAGSEGVLNNLQLVQNLVDWSVADTDLLAIRSRGNYTRTLDVPDDGRGRWEAINYALIALGLGTVVGGNALRRKRQTALVLAPRGDRGAAGDDPDSHTEDSDEEVDS